MGAPSPPQAKADGVAETRVGRGMLLIKLIKVRYEKGDLAPEVNRPSRDKVADKMGNNV